MAGISVRLIVLVLPLILALGCGVKAPPIQSAKLAPKQVKNLSARPVSGGIEVSFNVPSAEVPERKLARVKLLYGYLPLSGRADCPPCPPRLHKSHEFDLSGKGAELMKGARFVYVDKAAPLNKEAVYQVIVWDASGRRSDPGNLARAPRVTPPPAPRGLAAKPGDGVVTISWLGPKATEPDNKLDRFAGYLVYRKSQDGEKLMNARPLREPRLVDKTVANGQAYTYQVVAVRGIKKMLAPGARSQAVSVTPRDMVAPKSPSGLMAVDTKQGISLRFTPSPSKDVKGYILLRKEGKSGKWSRISKDLVTENTYVDSSAAPGKTYFYKVVAVDEYNNRSPESESYKITYNP